MSNDSPLNDLADLLADTQVRTRVSAERLAPSALYDLHYRETLIACAFGAYAKPDLAGVSRIHDQRLKLIQFVAARPVLLPMVRRWSKDRTNPQSALFAGSLRRGFLDDRMHDDVVSYLLAGRVLLRSGANLVFGDRADLLHRLYRDALDRDMFVHERRTLAALRPLVITNRMLEGR